MRGSEMQVFPRVRDSMRAISMEEEAMAELQKIAVVTGAGTGIGKAVALALMREGYAAVLAGRRKEKLDETAAEGSATGAKSLVVPTDVSDAQSIKTLFAKTKDTFGRLDLLFNNAGIGAPAVPLEELPYENWQKVDRHQFDRDVPVHAGSDQDHEGTGSARWPHHQ